VDSIEGVGTTFALRLPAAAALASLPVAAVELQPELADAMLAEEI
jgi:hypothetical protein